MAGNKTYSFGPDFWDAVSEPTFKIPNPFLRGNKRRADRERPSLARFQHVMHSLRRLIKHGKRKAEFDGRRRLLVDVEIVEQPLVDEHDRIWKSIHDTFRKAERIKKRAEAARSEGE